MSLCRRADYTWIEFLSCNFFVYKELKWKGLHLSTVAGVHKILAPSFSVLYTVTIDLGSSYFRDLISLVCSQKVICAERSDRFECSYASLFLIREVPCVGIVELYFPLVSHQLFDCSRSDLQLYVVIQ